MRALQGQIAGNMLGIKHTNTHTHTRVQKYFPYAFQEEVILGRTIHVSVYVCFEDFCSS